MCPIVTFLAVIRPEIIRNSVMTFITVKDQTVLVRRTVEQRERMRVSFTLHGLGHRHTSDMHIVLTDRTVVRKPGSILTARVASES
ncbi:hypothetical protein BRARA_E00421 [Brassica rapa]|uniref:Uncharacterized protein n=1 Tax=Brassica campestris TaxID=3711 RepID=A0A397Z6X9_BRACM|nr:hypothetical protein BRARA_E00421 [Brassica rapa]